MTTSAFRAVKNPASTSTSAKTHLLRNRHVVKKTEKRKALVKEVRQRIHRLLALSLAQYALVKCAALSGLFACLIASSPTVYAQNLRYSTPPASDVVAELIRRQQDLDTKQQLLEQRLQALEKRLQQQTTPAQSVQSEEHSSYAKSPRHVEIIKKDKPPAMSIPPDIYPIYQITP